MKNNRKFPQALPPSLEKVVAIDNALIQNAIDASRKSPRKRIIFPFHKSHSDNLHRMLNVLQPMSYIQPHRHLDPPKAESIIVLQGEVLFFIFTDTGAVESVFKLSANSFQIGIDNEPGIYHTMIATAEDTVLFEAKSGPYERSSDKDFAPWAPVEGSEGADAYMRNLYESAA